MSSLLARIGLVTAAHPWRTVCSWLGILVAALVLSGAFGDSPHDDYRVPGSASQAGSDLLTSRSPDWSGTDARVVVHNRTGSSIDAGDLTELGSRLAKVEHVSLVSEPRLSSAGDTALIEIRYDVPVTDFSGSEGVDAIRKATEATERAGLQVELGGEVPENFTTPSGTAEAIGLLAALVILVITLGSIVAAGLPLAVALAGLGVGFAGIGLLSAAIDVSNTAPTIASMVGLGVGIDYALLLVNRFTVGLRLGLDRRAAAAAANATAGLSVIVAGTTVMVALLGLRLAGLPIYASFGYATLLVVVAIMLASVTLVPALCALAGPRLLPRKHRRAYLARADGGATVHVLTTSTATRHWAERVGRQPVRYAIGATIVLLLLAAPVLNLRTWPQDAGSQPTSSTTRLAYDLVDKAFGPGANGPLLVVADVARLGPQGLERLSNRLTAEHGVAGVAPALLNKSGDTALIVVQPTTGPQDVRTTHLLERLRAEVVPAGSHITGVTAVFADISDRLTSRLWLVIAFVVGLSLLLLTLAFRSVVISVQAAVMNLLSVAAAYGVMVAIFQWGWGATLVGLPHAVPVSSWVPILMFVILFGLSMDYQVFLLSRVREEWMATGDARGSVVSGLASTGPIITSAAAIMVAVFIGFALDPDVTVKMMGVGMATAILIDATLVRMVLVPATMALLGRASWWVPPRLDRILPHLDLEGGSGPALPTTEDQDREPQPA